MGEEINSSFTIETELTEAYFDYLLRFIRDKYLLADQDRFANIELKLVNKKPTLSFRAIGSHGKGSVDVELTVGRPILVQLAHVGGDFAREEIERLEEDLTIGVNLFEERARTATIYFAWAEGERILPEKPPVSQRNIIRYMFSDSMLPLFILFAALSIYLFLVLGPYAPIVLVLAQFILVLASGRIIARMADWEITPQNPRVHLFAYQLPFDGQEDFRKKLKGVSLTEIKSEIYDKTLALGKPVDCSEIREILSKHGLECSAENMSTKIIDVYGIVRKAAEKFGLPLPRIVVENLTAPNAAASGPGPSQGVMLITTGLLVQLEDDEIYTVVGHEFSHLKGRDTLAFFALTSLEYLLRVYLIWPIVLYLGFFYFIIALGLVYFIAKFFEGKADLEAAKVLGQPKVLAEALRKIGFHRLQLERTPSFRIMEWIGWDPHPPIYFRVEQLEKLNTPERLGNPLVQSIKNNIQGFLSAFR